VRRTLAKVLESKILFRGEVFGVRRDRIIEPGGLEVIRDVVTHSGSVVLLPVFPDGSILLVRQYRHATGRFLWELVAGRKEPGERPLAAARRELVEETGYSAKRFQKFLDIYPTPGFGSESMVIFLATGLKAGVARPEDDERIVARRFRAAELEKMIRSGRLRDSKSISAILYYLRFIRRR
jgi:ADP-ribose pyrophosphatase